MSAATRFDPSAITRKRKALGWSSEWTAVQANISVWHLIHIESGHRKPGLTVLLRLADTLGIPPGELFTTSGERAA